MANTSEESDNLKETFQLTGVSENSSIQPTELPTQLTEIIIHSTESSTQSKKHQHKLQIHL